MSDTLAFLIDAPMQSWGASSKFQRRETESWPTKSALVGVFAAALGIDKHSPNESQKLAPLAALSFSVFRWPKKYPSLRLTDFHTIGGGYDKFDSWEKLHIPSKAGDGSAFGTVITRRSYLMDARFIALFQGDRSTLEAIAAALLDPVWGVWFGRKACIPAEPLSPIIATNPREALAVIQQKLSRDVAGGTNLEGLTEMPGPGSYYQSDQPLGFGQHHGSIPEAYHTRSVRRILASEL
jgi:CRISPR-associated protein Cas5/CasD subtype I-E